MTKPKPKSKRGRPSRRQASAAALAAVDVAAVDPRAILLQIAADTSAPATARVAACRALLAQPDAKPPENDEDDPVNALASRLLRGLKR